MSLLVAGNNPAAVKTAERNIFTATASQTTFTITQGYQPGDIDVYLNGVRLVDTEDYVASNGTTVVLNSGAAVNDSVVVVCFRPFQVADFYTKSEQDTRYVNAAGDTVGILQVRNETETGYASTLAESVTKSTLAIKTHSTDSTLTTFGGMSSGDAYIQRSNGPGTGSYNLTLNPFGGAVKMPNQPAFMANLSVDWSHPSGVQKVAGTFAADVNTGSNYSTSTKRFTAPVTGNYFISASVSTIGGVGTFSYLSSEIWVNGIRRIVGGWDGGGTSYGNTSVSGVVSLNANDYVELYCEASKTFTMASGSGYSFLSGHLIG